MKHFFRIVFLGIFLLLGCVGKQENRGSINIDTNTSVERIDDLLAEGKNLRALPLIVSRERLAKADPMHYQRAIDGLKLNWQTALDEGDWRRSIAYLRSFQVLGREELASGYKEIDFILAGIRSYIESHQLGAAAALVQDNIELKDISEEIRRELHDIFSEGGYRTIAAKLNPDAPPPFSDITPLIEGTVTVWVNKGVRLVGNVGVPDRGIGSGFFIDHEGYILTNYHVIESEVDPSYEGYSRLFIKIDEESGERIPAKVVGWDKNFDLALLKTEITPPYVFSFAEDGNLELGDKISAIGSPAGLMKTLTTGTVSAFSRSIQPMSRSFQIDVPINPGNSGGPLLNENGEVIGVVFAGIQGFEGVNFAIPGSYALRLIPSLYEGGKVRIAWLGLSAWDSTGKIVLNYVMPDSPAADAGLLSGDVLLRINNQLFHSIEEVQDYITTLSPDTLVSLQWKRNGKIMEGIAALDIRPDVPMREALSLDAREHLLTPLFGFSVERISGWNFLQDYRVLSILPGSIADEAGFVSGDTISLRRWKYFSESDAVALQLVLKGRKAGFLESVIQLAALLNINTVF